MLHQILTNFIAHKCTLEKQIIRSAYFEGQTSDPEHFELMIFLIVFRKFSCCISSYFIMCELYIVYSNSFATSAKRLKYAAAEPTVCNTMFYCKLVFTMMHSPKNIKLCSIVSELPCRNRTRALQGLYGLMTFGEQFSVPPALLRWHLYQSQCTIHMEERHPSPTMTNSSLCGAHFT
jgi:hypothetical protein